MIPRLQQKYQEEVLPALAEKLGTTNPLALPRLQKVVVNMGVGDAIQEKKYLETAVEALGLITGQKPVITRARQSIAGFKLREGMAIGCKVTLRRQRMYEFVDGNGNYSLGLVEQLVFPELNPDKFTRVQGLNIAFVTSTPSDDDARELLRMLGLPFRSADGSATDAA